MPRAARHVPIVALTADAFSETRDRCLVAGMNDFLTKPVSPQKLAASLRRLFGSRGRRRRLADDERRTRRCADARPADLGRRCWTAMPSIDMGAAGHAAPRLAALIHDFLDQGPAHRAAPARRRARRQPLELRVNAHAANGAALNLGLAALAATARCALHEGASHLPAHEIARLVQRFESSCSLTRQAVTRFRPPSPARPDAARVQVATG